MMYGIHCFLVLSCYVVGGTLLLYLVFAFIFHWHHEMNVAPYLVEEDHEDVRLYQRHPKR